MPILEQLKQRRQNPELFEQWRKSQADADLNELLRAMKPTIDSALFSFGGGDESLRLQANLLTVRALRSYDPKFKTQLTSHVYNTLKGLGRVREERMRAVHLPESRRLDLYNISRFKRDYFEKYDTDPSVPQIQDALGMSRKRVLQAEDVKPEVAGSQMETEKGDMPGRERSNNIWNDYVYHDLDETGRKIFEWTTGYNGRPILKKTEIAKRLKISPPAVSQRITSILAKVEEGQQFDD
jgi:DNA-directed RNA polymerase specialized sigma subunit